MDRKEFDLMPISDWFSFTSHQYEQRGVYRRVGAHFEVRLMDNERIERDLPFYDESLFRVSKDSFRFEDTCLPTGYSSELGEGVIINKYTTCHPSLYKNPYTGKWIQSRIWRFQVPIVGLCEFVKIKDTSND